MKGSTDSKPAENLPSAERARILARMVARSRMTRDRLFNTSARLPPTCIWIITATTRNRRSPSPTRRAMFDSASSRLRP